VIIKNQKFFIILLISLAVIARFAFLGRMSFWADELFTMNYFANEEKSIGQILYENVTYPNQSPPLFTLLVHLWLKIFGHRDGWLRTLPASISFLSLMAMLRLFGLMEKNKKVFFIYLSLLCFSGYYLYFGREVRPYGLLLLMAVLNQYYFLKDVKLFYSLTLLVGVYINPFMWLVFISQVFYLWLIRERSKILRVIKLSIPAVILYMPYLIIIGNVFRIYSAFPVFSFLTFRKLVGLFLHLTTGFKVATNVTVENYRYLFANIWFIPCLALTGIILLLVVKMGFERKLRDRIDLFCVVNIIVPILIVAVIYPRRLGPRSLCFIAPFYHFLIIKGMKFYSKKWGYIVLITMFLFINIVSGQNLIMSSINPYVPEDWKSLVRDVEIEGRYLIASNPELDLVRYYSNSSRMIGYDFTQDSTEGWVLIMERIGRSVPSSIAFLLREVEPYPLLSSIRKDPTRELLDKLFEKGDFQGVENYGQRLKVFKFELSQDN